MCQSLRKTGGLKRIQRRAGEAACFRYFAPPSQTIRKDLSLVAETNLESFADRSDSFGDFGWSSLRNSRSSNLLSSRILDTSARVHCAGERSRLSNNTRVKVFSAADIQ